MLLRGLGIVDARRNPSKASYIEPDGSAFQKQGTAYTRLKMATAPRQTTTHMVVLVSLSPRTVAARIVDPKIPIHRIGTYPALILSNHRQD